MQEQINLREKRSLGEIISATFNYLRFHFKPLYKILLATAGPVFLIAALFIGGFYGNVFGSFETQQAPDGLAIMSKFFVGMLVFAIGAVVLNGTVTEYMKASLTTPKNEITFKQILDGLKARFWNYFGASLLVIILIFLGSMALFIPGIWLYVVFSLIFFTIGIEQKSIGDGFTRSFSLMRGYWWHSFGLYILTGIIQSALTYALAIPLYVVNFLIMFSSGDINNMTENVGTVTSITSTFIMFISALTYSLSTIAAGVNYFSIVESKEEVGLKEKIEAVDTEN